MKDFVVHGVVTNIDFLQSVLAHPDFADDQITTRWVENNLQSENLLWKMQEQVPALHSIAAALADLTIVNRPSSIVQSNEPDPYSPWKTASGFRIGGSNE